MAKLLRSALPNLNPQPIHTLQKLKIFYLGVLVGTVGPRNWNEPPRCKINKLKNS